MKLTTDQINGAWELAAAGFKLIDVRALYRAKRVEGVSAWPLAFFTGWGIWNLAFFPLNQLYWSMAGGAVLVMVNATWLAMLWRYTRPTITFTNGSSIHFRGSHAEDLRPHL